MNKQNEKPEYTKKERLLYGFETIEKNFSVLRNRVLAEIPVRDSVEVNPDVSDKLKGLTSYSAIRAKLDEIEVNMRIDLNLIKEWNIQAQQIDAAMVNAFGAYKKGVLDLLDVIEKHKNPLVKVGQLSLDLGANSVKASEEDPIIAHMIHPQSLRPKPFVSDVQVQQLEIDLTAANLGATPQPPLPKKPDLLSASYIADITMDDVLNLGNPDYALENHVDKSNYKEKQFNADTVNLVGKEKPSRKRDDSRSWVYFFPTFRYIIKTAVANNLFEPLKEADIDKRYRKDADMVIDILQKYPKAWDMEGKKFLTPNSPIWEVFSNNDLIEPDSNDDYRKAIQKKFVDSVHQLRQGVYPFIAKSNRKGGYFKNQLIVLTKEGREYLLSDEPVDVSPDTLRQLFEKKKDEK